MKQSSDNVVKIVENMICVSKVQLQNELLNLTQRRKKKEALLEKRYDSFSL